MDPCGQKTQVRTLWRRLRTDSDDYGRAMDVRWSEAAHGQATSRNLRIASRMREWRLKPRTPSLLDCCYDVVDHQGDVVALVDVDVCAARASDVVERHHNGWAGSFQAV